MKRPASYSGMTMIEVLMAVALATFIVTIGFTGINAFGKSITRAKIFIAEAQIISATMTYAALMADESSQSAKSAQIFPWNVTILPVPSSWPEPSTNNTDNLLKLTFQSDLAKKTGGTLFSGLQAKDMTGTYENSIKMRMNMEFKWK